MPFPHELDARRVAHLRLDDGKANVLNQASCAAITDALARAAHDGAVALVVWGRPGMFSGGIDLALLRERESASRTAGLVRIAHTLLALWTAPLPTVAAVTGHAVAGGAVLAMACDRRVAVGGAFKLGVNETALGLVMPMWALVIVQAAIRPDRWAEAILLGRLYPPDEAVSIGIVDEVVDESELAAAVLAVTDEVSALPTSTYAATKQRLRADAARRAGARVAAEMGRGFGPGGREGAR